MTEDTIKPTLTPQEVCVILGVTRPTLDKLVESGQIQADRVGDLIRFDHEAIVDFICNGIEALREG